jgi:hypothetical protein
VVLNAAHPVLSNQATTAAQNAVVQEPLSGFYYRSHKKDDIYVSSLSFKTNATLITWHMYKLTFFAADETAEAEFFCFDSVAKHIVGKPYESLLKSMDISGSAPLGLAAIVGLKFTFAINININSFYSTEKIFNVDSILEAH